MKKDMSLQDIMLNELRRAKRKAQITLCTGECFCACIHGFDQQTVILDCGPAQHLVYKNSIVSIVSDIAILN